MKGFWVKASLNGRSGVRNGTRRNFWGADNAGGGDLRVREILINIGIIGDW